MSFEFVVKGHTYQQQLLLGLDIFLSFLGQGFFHLGWPVVPDLSGRVVVPVGHKHSIWSHHGRGRSTPHVRCPGQPIFAHPKSRRIATNGGKSSRRVKRWRSRSNGQHLQRTLAGTHHFQLVPLYATAHLRDLNGPSKPDLRTSYSNGNVMTWTYCLLFFGFDWFWFGFVIVLDSAVMAYWLGDYDSTNMVDRVMSAGKLRPVDCSTIVPKCRQSSRRLNNPFKKISSRNEKPS